MQILASFFVMCTAFGSVSAVESPLTEQAVLPLPFCYFENLYLDTTTKTFYTLGDTSGALKSVPIKQANAFEEHPTFIDGTTLFLFEPPQTQGYLGHFFHLLEHLVGIWSFYADANPGNIQHIVLVDEGLNWRPWQGPNQINRHLLSALFPQANVSVWNDFLNKYQGKIVCFKQAFTSDRALTFQSAECKKINKMLGAARRSLSKDSLDRLAEQVQNYAECSLEKDPHFLHVTYASRPPPRRLAPSIEKKMLKAIAKIPHVKLRKVDFAEMTFQEQIQAVSNTDVLISVHGNGLSHLLFLPADSCVVEIFPPDALLLDYRLLANARQCEYNGVVPNQGIISDEDAYKSGPRGEVNRPIDRFDIKTVVEIIQKRVNAHR